MPYPIIPQNITVHLGAPNEDATNVTVPFIDYIKNVASGEIFPTWPESALRANILAEITFALNRVYTEWYPAQGYDFDITSVTSYDQTYDPDREIFANISTLVDELFNDYLVREGEIQPFYSQYCDGVNTLCDGLSQWGSVDLAEEGYTPYDILRYYYGDDIRIIFNAPVAPNVPSWPGLPLGLGSAGEEVRTIQRELNAIAANYPAIPQIEVSEGIFDTETEAAVIVFQEVFDLPPTGIVDKATWYAIKYRFIGVRGLSELLGQGLTLSDVERIYPRQLGEGDEGNGVRVLQYYLAVLDFLAGREPLEITGVFDTATTQALFRFEEQEGLTANGIAQREDWNALTVAYKVAINQLPPDYQVYANLFFPGDFLVLGSSGTAVLVLQQYINRIAATDQAIPSVNLTGIYDEATREAVLVVQAQEGLSENGAVGPLTWQAIISRGASVA